ncbi:MAG: hypothetical protein SGPRY_008061, partial [Prymnesium sp.]
PELTASYLMYMADALLDHGLSLHAMLPLSLLRVVAADVLRQPCVERVVLLRVAQLQLQLGLSAAAEATREGLGPLGVTYETRRKNSLKLKELHSIPRGGGDGKAGGVTRRRKMAAMPEEAWWVSFAGLLTEEGQWSAAQEWLDEAEPLLRARGGGGGEEGEAHLSSCLLARARLHFVRGEARAAVTCQLRALSQPLELAVWSTAVVDLASYQAASGDEGGEQETLTRALGVCEQAVEQFTNSRPDAMRASARVHLALASLSLMELRTLEEGGMPVGEESARAAAHMEAAASSLMSVGWNGLAVRALVERAELMLAFPPSEGQQSEPLEAESSLLQESRIG